MSNASTIKNIENIRAKKAYSFAEKGVKLKNYDSYVKKIPMMIKTNGLGATLAFILSKGDDYKELNKNILDWLKDKDCPVNFLFNNDVNEKNLVKQIVSLNSNNYRAVTIEVLAFFNWLRRFAEGLIKGDD